LKRQVRWADALAEYDYAIKYIRRKWKILADALSRRPDGKPQLFMGEEEEYSSLQLGAITASTINLHEQVLTDLVKDYLADPELREEYLLPDDLKKQDGLLYNHLGKLVVPDGKLRMVLMHDYHDAITSGHLGIDKSLTNLQRTFTWPGMRRQLTVVISASATRQAAEYQPGCYNHSRCPRSRGSTSHSTSLWPYPAVTALTLSLS
jgi:hypothetical protein